VLKIGQYASNIPKWLVLYGGMLGLCTYVAITTHHYAFFAWRAQNVLRVIMWI